MSSVLLALVLSQVVAPGPAPEPPPPGVYAWSDGRRTQWLTLSPSLVAEPTPSEATKAQVLRAEPGAVVVVSTPFLRLWRVRDAAAVRAAVPALVPAFHDGKTAVGRVRVPLGLVCDGQPRPATWEQVLSLSGAKCLPDFWYPPVRK